MSSETSMIRESDPTHSSCFQQLKESKLTDLAFITGFVVTLILGLLCTAGIFRFIGTTNAMYLSYGMYAGATFFLIAEVIKMSINYCEGTTNGIRQLLGLTPALSNGEIQNLKNQLDIYIKENPEESQLIDKKNYMLEIISRTVFQNNPIDYMVAWKGDYQWQYQHENRELRGESSFNLKDFLRKDSFVYGFFVEEIRKIRTLPDSNPPSNWYGIMK